MDILVTGGTGSLGRSVVPELRGRGNRVRVLSRHPAIDDPDAFPGDIATGEGVEPAVRGADAVIHAASAARQPLRLRAVDIEGTRRLVDLSKRHGVSHFIYVSIVGMDDVPYPYYRYKLAAERIVGAGGVPFSIFRATQFPELIDLMLRGLAAIPRVLLVPPSWRFQVVNTKDVARGLAEAVAEPPGGMLPDFGGPKVQTLAQMAAEWLAARREERRTINVRIPGKLSRAFSQGRLLSPARMMGELTWWDWLRERYAAEPAPELAT